MYQNPRRAKKLYSDVVPKAVDEYLNHFKSLRVKKKMKKILNPVWHVHNGRPPKEKHIMPFSMLLNLVGSSNADKKEILWKFINRFHKDVKPEEYPILDQLTSYAINYYNDKIKPTKIYKKPNDQEKKALMNLATAIEKIKITDNPEEIQTVVYSTGKENGYEKKPKRLV